MLNIIVLVKQVPNTSEVKIDPETNNLIREGIPSIVNPYDLYAIEEALRLKEQYGAKVTALSMGPGMAADVLKEAIAMGADKGVLLSDYAFRGADTLATAYTLAAGVKEIGIPDLILCGKQAADGDTAQVPPELAEQLGMACITYVSKIYEINDEKIVVRRNLDYGDMEAEADLPAVITVQKGINDVRLPTLESMVVAAVQQIKTLTVKDVDVDENKISIAGSPTKVVKIFSPKTERRGRVLEGSLEEQLSVVMEQLQEGEFLVKEGVM